MLAAFAAMMTQLRSYPSAARACDPPPVDKHQRGGGAQPPQIDAARQGRVGAGPIDKSKRGLFARDSAEIARQGLEDLRDRAIAILLDLRAGDRPEMRPDRPISPIRRPVMLEPSPSTIRR